MPGDFTFFYSFVYFITEPWENQMKYATLVVGLMEKSDFE